MSTFKEISVEEAGRIQYDIQLWFQERGRGIRRSMFSPETRRRWPSDIKDHFHPTTCIQWYVKIDDDKPEYTPTNDSEEPQR